MMIKSVPLNIKSNSSFHENVESVQNNACVTITGAIRGTLTKK